MIIVVVTVNSSAIDLSSFGIVADQMLADFVAVAAASVTDIETVTAAATAAAVTAGVAASFYYLLIPM